MNEHEQEQLRINISNNSEDIQSLKDEVYEDNKKLRSEIEQLKSAMAEYVVTTNTAITQLVDAIQGKVDIDSVKIG